MMGHTCVTEMVTGAHIVFLATICSPIAVQVGYCWTKDETVRCKVSHKHFAFPLHVDTLQLPPGCLALSGLRRWQGAVV